MLARWSSEVINYFRKIEKTMPSLVNVLSSEVLAGSFFFVKVGKSK